MVKVWNVNGLLLDEFLYSSEHEDYAYPSGIHIVQFVDQNNNVIEVKKVVR